MERKVYTEREQIILATLVKEKGAIIENKRTDGTTLHNKNLAWEEVTKHYNIQPEINIKRNSQQLRKLWANLKQKKRKETTKAKHERLTTGGGLPDKKEEDPVLSMVDDAAPHADVEINNTWDSTYAFQQSAVIPQESILELSQGEEVEETIKLVIDEPNDDTANSAFETPARKKRKCDRNIRNTTIQQRLLEENALRVQKLNEGIIQQRELHALKMLAAEEELAAAKLRRELDEEKLKNFKIKCCNKDDH